MLNQMPLLPLYFIAGLMMGAGAQASSLQLHDLFPGKSNVVYAKAFAPAVELKHYAANP